MERLNLDVAVGVGATSSANLFTAAACGWLSGIAWPIFALISAIAVPEPSSIVAMSAARPVRLEKLDLAMRFPPRHTQDYLPRRRDGKPSAGFFASIRRFAPPWRPLYWDARRF